MNPSTTHTDQSRPVAVPECQEPVLNCGAERALRRAFGVDVNVLLVTRQFGEGVDIILRGLDPVADPEHRADVLAQPGKTLDDERLPRVAWCGINTH